MASTSLTIPDTDCAARFLGSPRPVSYLKYPSKTFPIGNYELCILVKFSQYH